MTESIIAKVLGGIPPGRCINTPNESATDPSNSRPLSTLAAARENESTATAESGPGIAAGLDSRTRHHIYPYCYQTCPSFNA